MRREEDIRQMPEDHRHLMGRGGARKGGLGRVAIVAKISEDMLFLKLKEEDTSGKGLGNRLKFYREELVVECYISLLPGVPP